MNKVHTDVIYTPRFAFAPGHKKICPINSDSSGNYTINPSCKSSSFCAYLCEKISPKSSKFCGVEDSVKSKIFGAAREGFVKNITKRIRVKVHSERPENKLDNSKFCGAEINTIKNVTKIVKAKPTSCIMLNFKEVQSDVETIEKEPIHSFTPNKNILQISNSSSIDNINSSDDLVSTITDSRYQKFNIKNAIITQEDCDELKDSWQLIIDENLNYFNEMKAGNLLPETKTAISWFYDIFYENVYIYDDIHKTNMVDIFKNNLKIQAHALMVIINNSLSIAKIYKSGKKVDLKKMHKVHDKIGIKYKNYITLFEILLITFNTCLREQWTYKMKLAWCKLISLLLKDILPHYIFQHLTSNIKRVIHLTTPSERRCAPQNHDTTAPSGRDPQNHDTT